MKALVRQAFAEFAAGNPEVFVDLLAPDVRYTVIGTTALSGTVHGRDVLVERILTPLAAALATPLGVEVVSMTAEEDRVVVQARGKSVLHSGVPYDNTYCFVFRLAGERIAEVTEYLDTALVARAFAVPAERDALRRMVDLNTWEMYREISRVARGAELRETPGVTMVRRPHASPWHNMVMVRDAVDPDALLAAVHGFYGPGGDPFSIWTRGHADAPLAAALRERGLADLFTMPQMVLLADPGTRCEPSGLEIRAVRSDAQRHDFIDVSTAAYVEAFQLSPALVADGFPSVASLCAPHVQGFLGYLDGAPVAAAGVWLSHGVAGINWVGTVPAHRGRRYGEALAWAAVREGFRRGALFASLQPTQFGRPVYDRMGFVAVAEYPVLVEPS